MTPTPPEEKKRAWYCDLCKQLWNSATTIIGKCPNKKCVSNGGDPWNP